MALNRAMRIDVVTVFPEMIRDALAHGIIKRAIDGGLVSIRVINLRDFTRDRHKTTDDAPYGGGGGMVMKVEPIARALVYLTSGAGTVDSVGPPGEAERADPEPAEMADFALRCRADGIRVALTDPRGARFNQATARAWAGEKHLILVCGRYEGVDDRVRQNLVTDEVSIGDYVLTGGELPALVIVDSLTRLQAGALGDASASENDSFTEHLLEYPHYTRPGEYLGWPVPEILRCGHHAEITRWRRWHQLRATHSRRPDLFAKLDPSALDDKLFHGSEPTAPIDKIRIRRTSNQNKKHEDTDGTGI